MNKVVAIRKDRYLLSGRQLHCEETYKTLEVSHGHTAAGGIGITGLPLPAEHPVADATLSWAAELKNRVISSRMPVTALCFDRRLSQSECGVFVPPKAGEKRE